MEQRNLNAWSKDIGVRGEGHTKEKIHREDWQGSPDLRKS